MRIDPSLRRSAAELLKTNPNAGDEQIVLGLVRLVDEPARIGDTNAFASLLDDISDGRFIEPLIRGIARGVPSRTSWLADYMYALIALLDRCDDYHPVHEEFVRLLGNWMLTTGGGEISWKAGDILSQVSCPASLEYLLKGAADRSLLHLTRIACMRGVVNQYPEAAGPMLAGLESDPDPKVREACQSAMAHLDRKRK